MGVNYPFAALVGQDVLKDALLWVAVDPGIGGVLVTGTRGTAKSTAVRALADLLPPIEVVPGDAFNLAPADGKPSARIATPFVELPVGATEDRVIGTLDVRSLLADGTRRFEPGLLARANRGILYVDEVNLLPDHLVDVLLDAAATGTNLVERDGASFSHDARIVLVGTMNPEEGELRPQLLDRFALCVPIENDGDVERRIEIVERRLAFERNPLAFRAAYAVDADTLRRRVERARALLRDVTIDRAALRHAASLALEARVEGMRADLTIARTARAIAALDERTSVTTDDVERAAGPALAHRRREAPRSTPPPRPPSPPRDRPRSEDGASSTQIFEVGAPADLSLRRDDLRAAEQRSPAALRRIAARGKSAAVLPAGAAHLVSRATPQLSALGTIRAAARARHEQHAGSPLEIKATHLRFIERRGRPRQLVVFLVDASGSMAAAARMRAAKGVVCALLEDAYRRRDEVALIAFRGEDAEVLVPPTRSAVLAYRRLRALATGGRTPLARGLERVRQLLAAHACRDPATRPHLVVVSDARANSPQHGAFEAALQEAAALRSAGVRALCVDTESGRLRLGNASQLAVALDAAYKQLDDCTERALGATVREWMASA